MARELQQLLEVLEGPLGSGVGGAVESALAGLLDLLRELASADADGRTRRAWTSAQNRCAGAALTRADRPASKAMRPSSSWA